MGVDFAALPLRLGLFGGEPCSEAAKREIEGRLGITRDGQLRPLGGHGARGQRASASARVDCTSPRTTCCGSSSTRVTGEPVAPGEEGELVFTSLTKEAFPVLRYRTHDLTTVTTERCECGRTLARMQRSGRALTTCSSSAA